MIPSDLALLTCPKTQAELELRIAEQRDGDVLEGELSAGKLRYRIRAGIPSFVPDDATSDQTIRSFSEKWDQHRYYREHTRRFYTEWYLARFGFADLDALREFLADKRYVLDAGTGAGRDASNFVECGRGTVFGVDTAWPALRVAAALAEESGVPLEKRVRLVHADITRLPFPDGFFDYINCDQVIHHTPDPPATFRALAKKLARGGQITTYVYRRKAIVREFVDDFVRERIKDEPFDKALEVARGFSELGEALAKLGATIELEHGIPVLGIPSGRFDLQRFVHWNLMKIFYNPEFDAHTNDVVNADWYHPVHCHRYSPEELRSWFDDGWEILAWDEQEAGTSCRARKL
jgi:SAM-dependent methyltransferase